MDDRVSSLFVVEGSREAVAEPDPAFERLLDFVRDARGFDYTGYRRPTLKRRFQKRLHAAGTATWAGYQRYLGDHPEEYAELFAATLINVTGFFRDADTWDVVAGEVIPQLLATRPDDAPLRVWSAGCASGEEPYTVAMLFAEALGKDALRQRVEIYATDVDEEALAQAHAATYTGRQLERVPPKLGDRYLTAAAGGFAIDEELRRAVTFVRSDLRRDPPPLSELDLLISRNTLVYFSPETRRRILGTFHAALADEGFLVAGPEALEGTPRLFVPHDRARGIFRKPDPDRAEREREAACCELRDTVAALERTNQLLEASHADLEAANAELELTSGQLETLTETLLSLSAEIETVQEELGERTEETLRANAVLDALLLRLERSAIVVDRALRVVASSPRATDLWGLGDGEVEGEPLLELDLGIGSQVERLRQPIRRVLAGAEPDDLELDSRDSRGEPLRIRISFSPLRSHPEAEEPDGAILLVAAARAD